jgi:hypothetical protein
MTTHPSKTSVPASVSLAGGETEEVRTEPLGQRALRRHSSAPELRAALAAIPIIGGSIDTLLATRRSQLAEERIGRLINELNAAVVRLDDSKVDWSVLSSEEFRRRPDLPMPIHDHGAWAVIGVS